VPCHFTVRAFNSGSRFTARLAQPNMSPQQVVQTDNLNIYPNPFAFNTIINFQLKVK